MSINQNFTTDHPTTPYTNILNSEVNNETYVLAINEETKETTFIHKTELYIKKYISTAEIKEFDSNSWFIYPYISFNDTVYEIELDEISKTCTFKIHEKEIIKSISTKKEIELPFGHILILNENKEIEKISHKASQISGLDLSVNNTNYTSEYPLIYEENIFSALPNIIIYYTKYSPQFDFLERKIFSNKELKYDSIDFEDIQKIQVPITEEYETAQINKLEIVNTNTIKLHCEDIDPDIWYFEDKSINKLLEKDFKEVNKLIIQQEAQEIYNSSEDLKQSGENLSFSNPKSDKISDESGSTHSLFKSLSVSNDFENIPQNSEAEILPLEKLESSVKLCNLNTPMNSSVSVIKGFEESLSDLQPLKESEFTYISPLDPQKSTPNEDKNIFINKNTSNEIIQEINELLLSQKIDYKDTDFIKNYASIKEEFTKIKNTTNFVSRCAEIKRISFKKTEYIKADVEFIKSLMYKKILICNSLKQELKEQDILKNLKKLNLKTNDFSNLLDRDFKGEVEFVNKQILGYLKGGYLIDNIREKNKERKIYKANEMFCPLNLKENLFNSTYKRIEASSIFYMNKLETNKVGYGFNTSQNTVVPKNTGLSENFKNTMVPKSPVSNTNSCTPMMGENKAPVFKKTPSLSSFSTPSLSPSPSFSTFTTSTKTVPPLNNNLIQNNPINQWSQGFQSKEANLSNIFNKNTSTNIFSKTNKQDELLKKLEKDLNNK